MAKIDMVYPRCTKTQGVIRNGHATSGAQRYRWKLCRQTFQLCFQYNAAKPNTHLSIIDMAMNSSGCRDTAPVLDICLNTVLRHLKTETETSEHNNIEPGAEVVICCEADEQRSFVRCKSNPRWLFYAYDRIQKRVLAHVFGPRNALTLQRLLALLRKFNIVFYMTDAWLVYRTQLNSAHHVVSKKYPQRIERHNLNLRTHLKLLTRRTIQKKCTIRSLAGI